MTAREVCMFLKESGISTAADVLKDWDSTKVAGDAFVKDLLLDLRDWLGWSGPQERENRELVKTIAREVERDVKEADLMRGEYKSMVRGILTFSCVCNVSPPKPAIKYDLIWCCTGRRASVCVGRSFS